MATKTYDPVQVVVSYAGVIIGGWADGEMIEVTRNEDSFKLKIGAVGDAVRSKNANRSGKVKLTLLQSSASNAILSAQQLLDQATSAGIAPLVIKDLNGTTVLAAAEAWVMKPADTHFAKEAKERVWTLECTDILMAVTGY